MNGGYKMSKKYHINKHGVPAACSTHINLCSYGGEKNHFSSYEKAKEHIDQLSEAVNGNITAPIDSPPQRLRSYYTSGTAINEFPLNKKISDLIDFDLIIISWLAAKEVKDGMKENRIGLAKFTYGDIVRVLEEELMLRDGIGLKLEGKYYNPIPFLLWEQQMKEQRNLYNNSIEKLSEELGFESMTMICLPMSARERLVEDRFLRSAENLNEVIYKVVPGISQFGNIISYNHSTGDISREFDIHEIAGAVNGDTLNELCYSKSIESRFEELWRSSEFNSSKEINYEDARDRYKKEQFFRGLEGTDIPRAFMRMSPIVAKEIAGFVSTHRTIMMAIGNIMNDRGVSEDTIPEALREEEDWIIE